MKKRIDKYKQDKYIFTFLQGNNKESLDIVSDLQIKTSNKENLDISEIVKTCKELIFDIVNDEIKFYAITYMFDTDRMSIKVNHALEISIKEENKEKEDEEVKQILALAYVEEIPIYPNDDIVENILEEYHRNMLTSGFILKGSDGKKTRLKLTKSIAEHINNPKILENLDFKNSYSPSDLLIIKSLISKEFSRLENVRTLLGSLEIAINKLENILLDDKRNENDIQRCLTENPILFGTDYAKLIHKPKLGSEYELDYALQKYTGEYELIEIESSTHSLYTKSGNPSQYLVHAEQQVIDWLHWIEKNNPYARVKLPELINPVGFVMIGRNTDNEQKQKLQRRNSIYRGQIIILTYDDLLLKAKNLLSNLQKLSNEKL